MPYPFLVLRLTRVLINQAACLKVTTPLLLCFGGLSSVLFLSYQPRRRDRALGEEGLVHSCWAALRFAALFYALQARAC